MNFFFFTNSFFNKFMLPFGRIWELGAGSLLAIYTLKNRTNFQNIHLNNFFIILGLILILGSIFIFNEHTPYPSIFTILPVAGTCLLILFLPQKHSLNLIFKNKYLVFLGLISYSLYLIHYPFFSLLNYYLVELNSVNITLSLLIIFSLSFLSWKYFEFPMRKKHSNKKTYTTIVSIYLVVILISIGIVNNQLILNNFEPKNLLKKSLDISSRDGNKCFDINNIHNTDNISEFCSIGNKNKSKFDFIITGDSHLVSYYNIFDKISLNENKKGIFVGYSGCTPFISIFSIRSDQRLRNCNKLNSKLFKFAEKYKIKDIILVGRWDYYTIGGKSKNFSFINTNKEGVGNIQTSRKAFIFGLDETIRKYNEIGSNIHLIDQPPFQNIHAKYIYNYLNKHQNKDSNKILLKFSVSSKESKNFNFKNNEIFKKKKLKYQNFFLYDPHNIFCENNNNKCIIGNKEYSYYLDENHLSIYE